MGYHVDPLTPDRGFGAIITDLDQDALNDPRTRQELLALWQDRGVLVVRGLPSDQETHIRLAQCLGEVEVDIGDQGGDGLLPGVVDVYAGEEDGDIYDFGNGDIRVGWLPWHFDLCFSDRINHGGILRAVSLPSASGSGGRQGYGNTGFIDHIQAYERLPEALRRKIEGLAVMYEMEFDAERMRFARPSRISTIRLQSRTARYAGRAHDFPRSIHPMVYRDDKGRAVLHVSPWYASAIEGHENAEGDALLEEVLRYVTDENLAYYHVWQPGDYVVWDNWRVMHCATGIPVGETRNLQRVSVVGDYRLGRMEAQARSGTSGGRRPGLG